MGLLVDGVWQQDGVRTKDGHFVRPATLDQAVAALAGEEAQAIAGGQTLIPTLKQRLASPDTLVSLTGIAGLRGVRAEGGVVRINGELWSARSLAGAVDLGERVVVEKVEGLKLYVRRPGAGLVSAKGR